PCIGARHDKKLRSRSGGDRGADFRLHGLSGDQYFSGHMAAALRRKLIFKVHGGDAHLLICPDRASDVLGVSVAIVNVDEHWQPRSLQGFPDRLRKLAETCETDVGKGITRAD